MMIFVLSFIFSLAFASPPIHWSSMLEIRERHEFYKDNEVLLKPKDSWQTLFAVVYPDRRLQLHKDCVFYRVPGESSGVFKIKTVDFDEGCEKYQETAGDTEIINLKALQFSYGNELSVNFTFTDFRTFKWNIPLMNRFKSPVPTALTSSAQYRAPKIILLAPERLPGKKKQPETRKRGELCHSISDDCQELSPSTCGQCAEGWYEVTNGCPIGPKYCGSSMCGLKGQPACRRGIKWQKVDKKFECRIDSSFAFCSPGLTIQCEGSRAFCH